MAKSKRRTLSLVGREIAKLVKEHGGQRALARKVGVSQALISKIVNGLQEPGEELIVAISKLPGVNSEVILEKASIAALGDGECFIPIAHSLLLGNPAAHPNGLTADHLQIANTDYSRSLYGVKGKSCRPACSDPDEAFQAEDIVVVDTAVGQFLRNIQRLDGKLVAIATKASKSGSVSLRRVFSEFDSQESQWILKTYADSKLEAILREKRTKRNRREKDQRVISLDTPSEKLAIKYVDQTVDLNSIVGVATQLLRRL